MTKSSQIIVDDIDVQIVRKNIKNLNLRVYSSDGRVRVAAPMHVSDDAVRLTVIDRMIWIKKQQLRLANRPEPLPREMVSGEQHYYLGEPYLLEVIERHGKHEVTIANNTDLLLYVKPGTDMDKRASVLNEWYRQQIKTIIPELIQKWEPVVGVRVDEWAIKKMKTRWGTCNISSRRIWLNLELMKKPVQCLEYVLVHEMVHLLERYHNKNFKAYMDRFMPDWRVQDALLKCEPLARDL
ncbi:MAG: M48 family metallopeptidase [Gammaproteobacteria bacterium]|nr:M48 family metallopeptidase [Gammaproteobacteria bacterium]